MKSKSLLLFALVAVAAAVTVFGGILTPDEAGVTLAMTGFVNLKASEQVAVVANIDPDAYAAGTVTSGWVDASKFHNFLAIVQAGDFVATGLLDAKIQQATDAAGTGAKDVTGKAITQLTQAGTDSNKQALINLRPEDLDLDNGFDHFRLSMTLTTAGADAGAVVLGVNPRDGFASANDDTTVDEIVA